MTALAVEPDGRLVVAGLFDFAGSTPAHFIVRLTADGAVDPTFQAGTNLNGTVDRMIRLADGRLVIAGTFSRWGDAEVPRVIRLHGDGTLDTGFESALPEDAVVFALAEQADGRLLVVGMPLGGLGVLWRLHIDGELRRLAPDGRRIQRRGALRRRAGRRTHPRGRRLPALRGI